MSWLSEDISFCANNGCGDTECERNPKRIRSKYPHTYALFEDCPKWNPDNAKWLTDQMAAPRKELDLTKALQELGIDPEQ